MRVQQELDETKVVLHKTIESVLQRGEKLDQLVERSDALNAQSKLFYRTAKKQVISRHWSRSCTDSLEFVLYGYVESPAGDRGGHFAFGAFYLDDLDILYFLDVQHILNKFVGRRNRVSLG